MYFSQKSLSHCSLSLPPVSRPPPPPQRLSPTSPQRPSLSPDRLLPTTPPPLSPSEGPASYSHQPTSSRLRAKFQGRRSYSEVRLDCRFKFVGNFFIEHFVLFCSETAYLLHRHVLQSIHLPSSQVSDPSAIQRHPARLMRDPVSTLPKPRSLLGEMQGYGHNAPQLRTSLVGLVRPASAHGAGGERGGGGGGERGGGSSLSSSPHHCALDLGFPLAAEVRERALLVFIKSETCLIGNSLI